MDPTRGDEEITRCLARLERGEPQALDELYPLIYDDLRALARSMFRDLPAGVTLQPTALVHESFLRLVGSQDRGWNNRRHFYNVAARAMRQLLADHARAKFTEKRGGARERVELDAVSDLGQPGVGLDLVVLDDALGELARLDERQARIVELRFLAGLSVEETANVLGVSERTVYLDWRMARSWLSKKLSAHPPS